MEYKEDYKTVSDIKEEFKKYIKPMSDNFTIEMDNELYTNLEIIRAYFSNKMITSNNTSILKIMLKSHLNNIEKEDPDRFKLIKQSIEEYIAENQNNR